MKLSKLKAICKDAGVIRLYDRWSGAPPQVEAPGLEDEPELEVREAALPVPYDPAAAPVVEANNEDADKVNSGEAGREGALGRSVLLEQWMGDNFCMFPLRRFPHLDESTLYAMLDLSTKEAEKISYYHSADPGGLDFADQVNRPEGAREGPLGGVAEAELMLERAPFSLLSGGREMQPLFGAEWPLFIDTTYLGPVADESGVELYLRIAPGGAPYIAIKSGLVLVGIILPQVGLSEGHTEELGKLAGMCSEHRAAKQRKRAESPDEEDDNA